MNDEQKKAPAVWRWIRCLSIAPSAAACALIALWLQKRDFFTGFGHFLGLCVCLVLLPLLCYPLKKLLNSRGKNGIGQRILAMIFAVSGYAAACVLNAAVGAGKEAWVFCLEFLLGGLFILLFNRILHVAASGHIGGVIGSVLLLAMNGLAWAVPVGAAVSLLVGFASLKTEHHTVLEMLGSCLIPFAVYLPLYFYFFQPWA
ncbi:MAG: hypothetical protein IKQ41_09985 [Clostridia bacterium]|nr:hypothetical protein [Clostridia bacterium]